MKTSNNLNAETTWIASTTLFVPSYLLSHSSEDWPDPDDFADWD